jgi:CheY-like chemotaxis protein
MGCPSSPCHPARAAGERSPPPFFELPPDSRRTGQLLAFQPHPADSEDGCGPLCHLDTIGVLVAEGSSLGAAWCRFFSEHGCGVETAPTAVACLAWLARSPPDVLVLDLDLPGGPSTVLDWLRAAWATQPVPAVVLVGDDPSWSVTGTILTSPVVAAYLQKPCDVAVLLDVARCAAAATWRRATREQRGAPGQLDRCKR